MPHLASSAKTILSRCGKTAKARKSTRARAPKIPRPVIALLKSPAGVAKHKSTSPSITAFGISMPPLKVFRMAIRVFGPALSQISWHSQEQIRWKLA
jgi:hypothetical protein